MVRYHNNRNRNKDGLHPSRRLSNRQLYKATHAKVSARGIIGPNDQIAKMLGLVVQSKLIPKELWIICEANTGRQVVEYDYRTGICISNSDGKAHQIGKRNVIGAIQLAGNYVNAFPLTDRSVTPVTKAPSTSQGYRNPQEFPTSAYVGNSITLRDKAIEIEIRAIRLDYRQYRLQAPKTEELLYIFDTVKNSCNTPGLLNPQIRAYSLDIAFGFAIERFRLPQVTVTSIVSLLNRTRSRRLKCTLFELGTEHLGTIEWVSTNDPLGSQLKMKRQGDIFCVNFPEATEEFKILRIAEP